MRKRASESERKGGNVRGREIGRERVQKIELERKKWGQEGGVGRGKRKARQTIPLVA